MRQRTIPLVTTLAVAAATVASAMATAGSPDGAQAQPPARAQVTGKAAREAKAAPRAAIKKAAPAAVKAEAVVMAPIMPAGFNNIEGQLQQFRPVLRSEFHIVRVACKPTAEQRKQIARDGERALREAAKKYVEGMQRPLTVAQRAALEPHRQVREGLLKSIRAHLSAEMAARYEQEIARREASHKELAIRNLVARLDHDLFLTHDQREKIEQSLTAHWDNSWCQSLDMLLQDNQFLPPIPDQYLAPHLNDAQKVVWRGTQKFYGFWNTFGMMGGVWVDDPFEDEELRAARLEAAGNGPKPDPNRPQGPAPNVMMRAVTVKVAPAPAPATKAATTKPAVPADPKKAIDPAKSKPAPRP